MAALRISLRFSSLFFPKPVFHLSAFRKFPLELLVGGGQLGSSLRHSLFQFVGNPLLLAAEPRLLQPDRGLIRSHAQQKSFRLRREIRSPGPGYDDANFPLQPQAQRQH